METANEARVEKLKDENMNLAEINYPVYAAATVITEEENRTGCYKS